LEAMKIKDLKDISSYITHVQIVANQFKRNGETLWKYCMYNQGVKKFGRNDHG